MRRVLLIIGVLILALGVGYLTLTPHGQLTLAFIIEDARRYPLIKRFEKDAYAQSVEWGEQASHDINIFYGKSDRAAVEILLKRAEFEKKNEISDLVEARKEGAFEFGSDIYAAHIDGLPCAKILYLFLWFDETDTLTAAKSAQFEAGCL